MPSRAFWLTGRIRWRVYNGWPGIPSSVTLFRCFWTKAEAMSFARDCIAGDPFTQWTVSPEGYGANMVDHLNYPGINCDSSGQLLLF